jgi:hypothetical protein
LEDKKLSSIFSNIYICEVETRVFLPAATRCQQGSNQRVLLSIMRAAPAFFRRIFTDLWAEAKKKWECALPESNPGQASFLSIMRATTRCQQGSNQRVLLSIMRAALAYLQICEVEAKKKWEHDQLVNMQILSPPKFLRGSRAAKI